MGGGSEGVHNGQEEKDSVELLGQEHQGETESKAVLGQEHQGEAESKAASRNSKDRQAKTQKKTALAIPIVNVEFERYSFCYSFL